MGLSFSFSSELFCWYALCSEFSCTRGKPCSPSRGLRLEVRQERDDQSRTGGGGSGCVNCTELVLVGSTQYIHVLVCAKKLQREVDQARALSIAWVNQLAAESRRGFK